MHLDLGHVHAARPLRRPVADPAEPRPYRPPLAVGRHRLLRALPTAADLAAQVGRRSRKTMPAAADPVAEIGRQAARAP